MLIGAKPWLADTQHPLYEAGKAAVKRGTEKTLHPTLSTRHCIKILYIDNKAEENCNYKTITNCKNIQAVVIQILVIQYGILCRFL